MPPSHGHDSKGKITRMGSEPLPVHLCPLSHLDDPEPSSGCTAACSMEVDAEMEFGGQDLD